MRYLDFKEKLKEFDIFSLSDIRKIDPAFAGARLTEWQSKGYIRKLRRGFYTFADRVPDESALFLIANRLYAPSYISLESALSHYGLIPEGVYAVTSVTSKKTARFATPLAEFSYRTVRPSLMFGYAMCEGSRGQYKIADMEKAVLDYLYLNPHIAREADFHEWRFDSAGFLARADLKKLYTYADVFRHAERPRLDALLALMRHAA
ncbi:hypothetical protein HYT05_00270 [Candidatus Kaiserbacteria bacterium]|nr:hypothetical protein [Candidatus Kaiserbacteria bacterium]